MDYEKWGQKIIQDHKNPIVKYHTIKPKLFLPLYNEVEKELLEKNLDALKTNLLAERAEIRSNRCKGEWLNGKIKLNHLVGSKTHFMGFACKDGRFMFSEEGLFMLETNRAEILYNSVPMSIEQAYELFLPAVMDLNKYKAYKKLLLRGYDVVRLEISQKKLLKSEAPLKKKIKLDIPEELHEVESGNVMCTTISKTVDRSRSEEIDFRRIFEKLQEQGPKVNMLQFDKSCDYKIGASSKVKNEYDLHFMSGSQLDPKIGFYKENFANIYCNPDYNDLMFTRFSSVHLPILECE